MSEPSSAVSAEAGPGLLELNLGARDGLRAADDAVYLKLAAKAIAKSIGPSASFLAKTTVGEEGSSGHVRLCWWREGANAFTDERLMGAAIAGILDHLPAASLLLNPTINSYQRLIPGWFAPVNVSWGVENRSAAVRAISSEDHPQRCRIECRRPGADANPYLALAALVASAADGIEREAVPPPAVEGDASEREDLRSKMVPLEHVLRYAQGGLNMYGGTAVLDSRSDVVPWTLYNEEIAYADQRLRPDPTTARLLPWAHNTGRMICDTFWDDGRALEAAPGHVFQAGARSLPRARVRHADRYRARVLPTRQSDPRAPLFGYHIFNTVRNTCVPVIERIVSEMRAFGIDIITANCEYAGSEWEINYGPGAGIEGPDTFIAGQLRRRRSIYALLAPTLNCLKRRRRHTFSPTNVSWGPEDRGAFVRINGGSPESRHLENRVPTGMCNPYLASAALVAAGLLGVMDDLPLEAPAAAPEEEDESKPPLPTIVEESLSLLEGDERIVELLGHELVTAYTVMRRQELQRFADHVTDWELEEYLEVY